MDQLLSGKKILWVEDDQFLSNLIAKKLSSHGAMVLAANTGESAVQMLDQGKLDVVLLDLMLPGLDGYEVLKKVKESENTKNTPVIIFSNLGQKEDIDKGMKMGAAKFIVKASIIPDEIVNEVQAVLKK